MTAINPVGGKSATTSMTDLRNKLLDIFDSLRASAIPLDRAKELSNAAGKIINSARAEIEYAKARKETPDIPFMK